MGRAKTIDLDFQDIMKQTKMVVNLKNVKQWRWRMKIGMWFIYIACLVMGCGIEFEGMDDGKS